MFINRMFILWVLMVSGVLMQYTKADSGLLQAAEMGRAFVKGDSHVSMENAELAGVTVSAAPEFL